MDLPHQPGTIPDYGGIKGVPSRSKLTLTKVEPFKFQEIRSKPSFDFAPKPVVHKSDENFMKKALAGHQLPQIEPKSVTIASEVKNHLDKRGKERRKYDEQEAQRRKEIEQKQRIEEEERARQEEQ